jgi:hypothetical protein
MYWGVSEVAAEAVDVTAIQATGSTTATWRKIRRGRLNLLRTSLKIFIDCSLFFELR